MASDFLISNKWELPFKDVWNASQICRKHKSTTSSCREFEFNNLFNVVNLWEELKNKTYTIFPSICFIVPYPHPREVFAAAYRDRIPQHLLLSYISSTLHRCFIHNTYSTIKYRGPLFGTKQITRLIRRITHNYTEDAWYLKLDLKNNFGSLNKQYLIKALDCCLNISYHQDNKEFCLWLMHLIINNDVTKNCVFKSPKSQWEKLSPQKSLFNHPNTGLPIGNITSQEFNNFYISLVDHFILKNKFKYLGRYVDDIFIFSKNKKRLINIINPLRNFIKEIGLNLNEKKVFIQKCNSGIDIFGKKIYPTTSILRETTTNKIKDRFIHLSNKDDVLCKLNSSSGFLSNVKGYNKLEYLTNYLDEDIKSEFIQYKFKYLPRNKYESLINRLNRKAYKQRWTIQIL